MNIVSLFLCKKIYKKGKKNFTFIFLCDRISPYQKKEVWKMDEYELEALVLAMLSDDDNSNNSSSDDEE